MPKFHTLKIIDIRRETADTVSIAFSIPDSLTQDYQFLPGQYLTFKREIDGEEVRRSYSICSSEEETLRVAVKKVPKGRFSTFANEVLQPGDELEVMTPMGRFTTPIDAQHQKQYVAFCAGSGITPILSILKTVLQKEPRSQFTLFYGNKNFDSIIFREEIEALKNKYLGRLSVHHVLSRERLGSPLFTGRIDVEKCNAFAKTFFDPKEVDAFFLCGPETMIRSVTESLVNLGADSKRVHFELFTSPAGNLGGKKIATATAVEVVDGYQSKVTVVLDGDAFDFSLDYGGDNVLDAALKQGADLPFACKGGVCCTCRARLLEGEVKMDVNYALEEEEVKAGFILTCQSHPRSERIVVDFDEK